MLGGEGTQSWDRVGVALTTTGRARGWEALWFWGSQLLRGWEAGLGAPLVLGVSTAVGLVRGWDWVAGNLPVPGWGCWVPWGSLVRSPSRMRDRGSQALWGWDRAARTPRVGVQQGCPRVGALGHPHQVGKGRHKLGQ